MTDCIARTILGLLLFTMTTWICPSINWAATLYAKQDDVKVTAEKSPTSTVIATLSLGDAVTVLAEEGRLANVKVTNGKTGWVFKFRLSEDKPSSGGGGLGLSGLTGKHTIAARESRAGGSIRGLKESTEQYAKIKQIKPEYRQAVDRMEAFSLAPEEFMQFKKAGNLGEFSGGAQ
jgi:uncharacterized protein YgiM (DUF1202 family)